MTVETLILRGMKQPRISFTWNPGLVASLTPGLFVVLWSTGFVAARSGLDHAGPLSFLTVRYLVVIVLLLVVAVISRAPWPRGLRQWLRIGISGILIHACYLAGIYLAIADGLPVGVASLIVCLQPLLTAFAAGLLLAEKVTGRQWLGLSLGLIGTIFVVSARLTGGYGLIGLPAVFGALFGITAGSLYQKRFCPRFDYRTGAVVQYIPAAAMTAVALYFFENFRIDWNPSFIVALGWLTVVLSVAGVGLFNYLIRTASATRVASLFYLVPACTALIAWLRFDERLDATVVAGMVLVMIGVHLARQRTEKA